MYHIVKDISGQRFKRLIVVSRNYVVRMVSWNCLCDCGNTVVVINYRLLSGNTKSCGCYSGYKTAERNYRHGLTDHRLYGVWQNMRDRCDNEKNSHYGRYGGRGIKVCDEWKNSFINFYTWVMANGYDEKLQLDRIDNDGNYAPANCRFVTATINIRNSSVVRNIKYNGEVKALSEWCEVLKLKYSTVAQRLNKLKWPPEKAFTYIYKGRGIR